MGASGAGKTSLMNILACRISHQSNGKLLVNSLEYDYDSFGNFWNYVMQKCPFTNSDCKINSMVCKQSQA